MQIEPYSDAHFGGVETLWQAVFPNDPPRNQAASSIPQKLEVGDGLFWVALGPDQDVIGTIMAGWDGHRGWLYSVAVADRQRRSGVGKALVETALEALKERGCKKVNLQIRAGNENVAAFYESLGFSLEPRTSMGREI